MGGVLRGVLLVVASGVVLILGLFIWLAFSLQEQDLDGLARGSQPLRGAPISFSTTSNLGGACRSTLYVLSEEAADRVAAGGAAVLADPTGVEDLAAPQSSGWRRGPAALETVPWNPQACKPELAADLAAALARPETVFAVVRGADEAVVLALDPDEGEYRLLRFSYEQGGETHLGQSAR